MSFSKNFENPIMTASVIFMMIGALVVIPKIADAASNFKVVAPKPEAVAEENSRKSGYEPPDFGHPSSVYGSGTR